MNLTRRHFLIHGTSLLGACFSPRAVPRRIAHEHLNPAAVILPALQHRLRELGENVAIEVIA